MMRLTWSPLLLLLAVLTPAATQNEPPRDTVLRLRALTARTDLDPQNVFLHEQVALMIERCRRAPVGAFLVERLHLAMRDLLEASERIVEARTGRPGDDRTEETRRLMARDLERTYFRIQQGDYFSRQFPDSSGPQYVRTARLLYQLARAAYDDREYVRVRLLSEAARDIVMALERLAQAEVGVPDPPRISEG
jgi:hypothetical protein